MSNRVCRRYAQYFDNKTTSLNIKDENNKASIIYDLLRYSRIILSNIPDLN